MNIKYKRRAPAKVIVMGVLFVVMALAATAGIVTVLALASRSINSNVNIMYTAVDIDGEVEAAYKIGDSGTWVSMNGSSPYRFSADDQTSNKQMNPANIELTSQNRYVEFRYIFRNYGHVDYTAILSLNEVDENNNIKLDYKYNDKSYTPTGYGLVIEGTNSPVAGKVQTNEDGEEYVEMTYYVKVSVKQLTRDANYQSDFFWLLENYEAQPGEETIRLATSNYTDNGDGTYSASYSGANISVASMMADDSTPSIENIWNVPSRFGSASVTKVKPGDELPANTKVILSDSITTIEYGTFSYENEQWMIVGVPGLSEIVIGNGITQISDMTFYNCSNLRSVTIGNNVTSIGSNAFAFCDMLQAVTLGNVTTIGQSAFWGCSNLANIEIPNSVTTIGQSAFYECTSLKEITIPSSVTSIGFEAFANCAGVEVLNYNASVTTAFTSSSNVFKNLGRNATKTVVNINSTVIPGYLLYQCSGVDEINISDIVTSIGSNAFYYCYGLTSVEIGSGVTSIGNYAFYNCSGLTSVEIGSGVTSIGSRAFSSCSGLTSVVIPNSVISIGDYAFSYCSRLISVVIPNSVTSIGSSAFYYCSRLISVVIPNSVTSIGSDAFEYCYKLVEIYDLRTTQMTAGSYGTNSYTRILSSGANSVIHTDSNGIQYFEYETGKCKVMGYTGTETEITILSTINGCKVTEIMQGAFSNNPNIVKVVIPNSVTEIGDSAFLGCSGLTSIVIPDSVTSLGNGLFFETTILTKIVIGNGVRSLNGACAGAYGLTSVTIGSGVTSMDSSEFGGCWKLAEIYNLSSIEINPGDYGTKEDVKILKSGENSIIATDSNGLQYAELESGQYKVIGYVGPNVEEVTIPSSFNGKPITSIRSYAFFAINNIKKLIISDSVTTLENYSFFCTSLSEVVIGANVTTIGIEAFFDCSVNRIEFKNPNGWSVADSLTGTQWTNVTLSATDFGLNASYLTSTYCYRYWKRG